MKILNIKKVFVCLIFILQLLQIFHNALIKNVGANINFTNIADLIDLLEPIYKTPFEMSITLIGMTGIFIYLVNTLLQKQKFLGIKQRWLGLFSLIFVLLSYFSVNGNTWVEYANSLALRNIWLCLVASIITIDFIEVKFIQTNKYDNK